MERSASTTALGVAALRAFHHLIDHEPKILDDPIVPHLIDRGTIDQIRSQSERFRHPMSASLRSHVVLRRRYTEDRLAEAVQRDGIAQYVILGAGLDTFAYRQPPWASQLRIFEVDHPASQAVKRQRLEQAGIPLPANLEFAAIDF